MEEKIRIGISSCLLGNTVRYNGGHCRDDYVVSTLGNYFEFVPVCPEVECGLPVPRESLRLVGAPEAPRLVTTRSGVDHTDRMMAWAEEKVRMLEGEALCGFIFKKDSPSSGMTRVKVYPETGGLPTKTGVGMFARAFMDHFPLIPTEEEGRLHDPGIRENFIDRIFVLKRWRDIAPRKRPGDLVAFHTRHKLLILSHSETAYREMGRWVAQMGDMDDLFGRYEARLMGALALPATVKKQVNVLQHMAGYFKRVLSGDEKRELSEVIDQYRLELVPLIVAVTLINHYVRKYDEPYLKDQVYLNPHPLALKLRNHA